MKASSVFSAILAASGSVALASAIRRHPTGIITVDDDLDKRDLLQDVVTWDEHSIFIHGERAMIFSAEMHPFRYYIASDCSNTLNPNVPQSSADADSSFIISASQFPLYGST